MNTDTGEIKSYEKLTLGQKKSGKWIELSDSIADKLKAMNRKERREFLKKNGKFSKGKWGWR